MVHNIQNIIKKLNLLLIYITHVKQWHNRSSPITTTFCHLVACMFLLLVTGILCRPIMQSEREMAVKVSRQEQRHLGRPFLPYRPNRSVLCPSQITSKPISASILSHSLNHCLSLHGVMSSRHF